MRESKRGITPKRYITPIKAYRSVQISSCFSLQTSPKAGSKPKDLLSKAKSNIEYLSQEVKKHKRECAELDGVLELSKKHGDGLHQKVSQLRQQLELVLQQNVKLAAAKSELSHNVNKAIKEKEQLKKEKAESKAILCKKLEEIKKADAKTEKRHAKDMENIKIKVNKQNEVRLLLEQKIEMARSEMKDLEKVKREMTKENGKMDEEFSQEIDILSHIITIS